MFLFSCGRSSVTSTPIEIQTEAPCLSYETFFNPDAPSSHIKYAIPKQHLSPEQEDEEDKNDASSGSNRKTGLGSNRQLGKESNRLDALMSGYDSLQKRQTSLSDCRQGQNGQSSKANKLLALYYPSIWGKEFGSTLSSPNSGTICHGTRGLRLPTTNNKLDSFSSSLLTDGDEMKIPDRYVGFYQFFCDPNSWSPAFASPGDFTIKIVSVCVRDGEIWFKLAVICGCIKTIQDGVRMKEISKRKSYVKHVERKEKHLIALADALSLQYLGHDLAQRLRRNLSRLPTYTSIHKLEAFREITLEFLSYVLKITEIGFNRLICISEPIVKNVLTRDFLDLPLGFGDPNMKATSSCDARIERQDQRPLLPSAWYSNNNNNELPAFTTVATGTRTNTAAAIQSKSFYFRSSLPSPSGGGGGGGGGVDDDLLSRSYTHLSDSDISFSDTFPHIRRPRNRPEASRCIKFILPQRWHTEKFADGAFTIEITSLHIRQSHADYCISVLYYQKGRLETILVERRFNEFVSLAKKIDTKIPNLGVLQLLPSKTFFRYLSACFLEKRALLLQRFMEKFLKMTFLGILGQEIPMTAEPNVRRFFALPNVQWSLVPRKHDVATTACGSIKLSERKPVLFSPSNDFSPSIKKNQNHLTNQEESPRYFTMVKRRSDSM